MNIRYRSSHRCRRPKCVNFARRHIHHYLTMGSQIGVVILWYIQCWIRSTSLCCVPCILYKMCINIFSKTNWRKILKKKTKNNYYVGHVASRSSAWNLKSTLRSWGPEITFIICILWHLDNFILLRKESVRSLSVIRNWVAGESNWDGVELFVYLVIQHLTFKYLFYPSFLLFL